MTSPPASRRRRSRWRDPRLWLGAILVLAAVVVGARIFAVADDTVAVWRVARDVPAGTTVSAADLESTRIHFADAADGAWFWPVEEPLPPGAVSVRDLVDGEVLSRAALSAGSAAVSRQLPLGVESAGLPADLSPGDRVDVWAVPQADTVTGSVQPGRGMRPELALSDVSVVSVGQAGPGGLGSTQQVLVALPDAVKVADVLASLNGASLVLVRHGG